ncbi:MAG: BadF/BadG/BcrA/BcrD ATPase family protein, partial [Acidobacteriaceae bacterium]
MEAEKLVLIADSGATHTRALVVTIDGQILGAGRSGAGNAFAIGHAAACRNLKIALIAALKDARMRPTRLAFTVVGSASVTHDGRGAKPIMED